MFGLFKKKKKKMKDLFDPNKAKTGSKTDFNPKDGGKYPSTPIYREVVFRPRADGISCPKCGSKLIRPAGYGDRLECQSTKCGHVFR
ncbi:MAG: hypothetical protein V3T73_00190 [Dehalococcoidales bacterium]|jgi:hypothetical protein